MCGLQHWPILGSSDFLGKDAEHPAVVEEKKEGEGEKKDTEGGDKKEGEGNGENPPE